MRAELAAERSKNLVPVVIVIGIIVLLALLIFIVVRRRQHPELDLDAAIDYEKPRARERAGFPEDYFPMVKVTARSFERLKGQAGVETNEYMYFIEYQFLRAGKENAYHHGLHGHASTVVTVALTSKTYRFREQWYDWTKIKQAIEETHRAELWGFSLQKTKIVEGFTDALDKVRSFNELQREYAPSDASAES